MIRSVVLATSLLSVMLASVCCCPQSAVDGVLLSEASVAPTTLPFSGGTIVITASVSRAVDEPVSVTATVTYPDGDTEEVGLHPATDDAPSLRAVFDIPANSDGDGAAETYEVLLVAETETGSLRQELDLGIVTVAGAMDPPSPPQD